MVMRRGNQNPALSPIGARNKYRKFLIFLKSCFRHVNGLYGSFIELVNTRVAYADRWTLALLKYIPAEQDSAGVVAISLERREYILSLSAKILAKMYSI